MVLAELPTEGVLAAPLLLVSLASMVTMITMVTMCTTCCRKKVKNGDDDDVAYGVIAVTTDVEPGTTVQFRNSGSNKGDRHSQPATKTCAASSLPTRSSVPLSGATRRALPQLPESQTYAVINKPGKDFQYADEPAPMYECIDPENDSFVDPLYSKVDTRSNRKYDYPVFSGNDRKRNAAAGQPSSDDMFYQSASAIYAAGSEDPYSSIASEPRVTLASAEDDESSAYDPGYAKVKAGKEADKERTERELDQLYSKIRRGSCRRELDSPQPGSSNVELTEPMGEVTHDMVNAANTNPDEASSREPSYRYITVRESADAVRERLRQQGQLEPPVREHYYSTIGNEYESVGDGSTTYSRVNLPANGSSASRAHPAVPNALSINVATEFVPPPPTSPIPDRTPDQISEMVRVHPSASLSSNPLIAPSGATYSTVTKPRKATTPSGPSPTIPTVVKPPNRLSGAFDVEPVPQTRTMEVTRPTVVSTHSTHSTHVEPLRNSPTTAIQGIHEFMHRPLLPYGTAADAVVNRRVTEERETVVEKRRSSGPTLDVLLTPSHLIRDSGALHNNNNTVERVHLVEIKRVPEYSVGIHHDSSVPQRTMDARDLQPLQLNSMTYQQGPSSPYNPAAPVVSNGTLIHELAEPPMSERSRSALPILKNDSEVRMLAERSRTRRQESVEREERDKERDRQRTLSRDRRQRERAEEERRKERLGTIYTANDYVSPVGMTTERGWPLVGSSSPPSLRKSSRSGDEGARFPSDSRHTPISSSSAANPSNGLLTWALSSSDSECSENGDGGGGCEDGACFCHTASPRGIVEKNNQAQMKEIYWGLPLPDVPPPM